MAEIKSVPLDGLPDVNGQVNLDQYINKIENFNSDAIDYLYALEPQSQNLFWAGYFCEASSGSNQEKAIYHASYRIRKIQLPFPKMDIDQQNDLRVPLFKSASYSMEITIDWLEDVYHSIQKYHLDWFNRWYNREFDVLRCGVGGKFRKLICVAYHYVNSDTDSLIEVPVVQPIMSFFIGGMVPIDIPDMTFDHSADQNDSPISIRYKCGTIHWGYSKDMGMGKDAGGIWGGSTPGGNVDAMKSWNPGGFANNDFTGGENANLEKFVITRSATQRFAGEGKIC